MAQAAQQQPMQTLTHKVVLLGATAVGKTSIFNRIQSDQYIEDNVTTLAAYWRPKVVEIPEKNLKVKINLWDTAGQERFQSLTAQYIQGATGVILVYDITDSDTVQEAKDWHNRIKQQADPEQLVIALVGNKSDDIERLQVSRKDGQQLQRDVGALFQMEVSAKSGSKIEAMFNQLAQELMKRDPSANRSQSMILKEQNAKKKGGCCGGKDKKDKK